ncbi:MAG TPA: hypothetical protein VF483_02010, partial [Gemmatimonadaceae bacterium]
NPPLPRVQWSLRNNNNYEQTGLLVSLSYVANNKRQLLQNFYEKSKRSIAKAKTEGPAAYVLPANDPRIGAQGELLRVLQKQAVEISRATADFTVQMPVRRPAGGGRGGRGAAASASPDSAGSSPRGAAEYETRTFPAGSYIIRMDQPYSRIADALLDYQFWSPNDPQKQPYDDTGWTFPEGFAVQCVRVTDVKVLDVPVTKVTDVMVPGGVSGSGSVFLINANGDNGIATLRYKLKGADMQAAEESLESGGQKFNRGSLIVSKVSQADLDKAAKEFGVKAVAVAAAPSVKTHAVRAARVAIMHTWQSTQTEGWWRQGFDFNQIPYDYISTQDISRTPNLNAKWDVIVFGPGGGNGQSIIEGMAMWRNPMPWKNTPETPNIGTWAQTDDMRPGLGLDGLAKLQAFVKQDGVLITSGNTADFAINYGLANGVSSSTAQRLHVVGSLLRSKLVDDASPIAYGIIDNLALFSDDGQTLRVSATRGGGGFGGGGGGGGGGRPTGRGTADDADVVQGMPALDPKFQAPPRPVVQPWQYAPISDDQLRNPLNVIPPDQRPRTILRYADQRELL